MLGFQNRNKTLFVLYKGCFVYNFDITFKWYRLIFHWSLLVETFAKTSSGALCKHHKIIYWRRNETIPINIVNFAIGLWTILGVMEFTHIDELTKLHDVALLTINYLKTFAIRLMTASKLCLSFNLTIILYSHTNTNIKQYFI